MSTHTHPKGFCLPPDQTPASSSSFSQPRFTPPPWCFENIGEKENCYAVGVAWRWDDPDDTPIDGKLTSYDEDGKEIVYREAICFLEEGMLSLGGDIHSNARLIAAAPKLYKALCAILDITVEGTPLWAFDGPAVENALAILAEARGDSTR